MCFKSLFVLLVDKINYLLATDSVALEKLCLAGRHGQWDPLAIPLVR